MRALRQMRKYEEEKKREMRELLSDFVEDFTNTGAACAEQKRRQRMETEKKDMEEKKRGGQKGSGSTKNERETNARRERRARESREREETGGDREKIIE